MGLGGRGEGAPIAVLRGLGRGGERGVKGKGPREEGGD